MAARLDSFYYGKEKHMKKKVLVLDIDGTLTNSQKEITPATKEALDEIRRRGHIVVLASGRPTGGLRMITKALDFEHFGGYTISYNGACVTDAITGDAVFKNPLPDYAAPWMQEYAREHGLGMCSYVGNVLLLGAHADRFIERETHLNQFTRLPVESFASYRKADLYKVLLTAQPTLAREHEARLARRFMNRLSIYRSEPFFIEVMNRGVNKADAIAGLLERLELEREDVIACGDGLNDLTMIKYAGLGVAMGNAQPAVKEAADVVTLSNDEEGLVPIIEKYILG